MRRILAILILLAAWPLPVSAEDEKSVTVGVATVLTGDLALLGKNISMTVETYRRHYLRHPVRFVFEDSKLNGADGLRAYQKLLSVDHPDMLIAASSSNGTLAASGLINSSKTPAISVVTGGRGIDNAGPFIFRIGNSDTLNGLQEAEEFKREGKARVAVLTEETEYTQDIENAFVPKFKELGGEVVLQQSFPPGTADYRSHVTALRSADPDGILFLSQTGTSLALFLKQWREQKGESVSLHTTFVAAPNAEAHAIAGDAIYNVAFMAPSYDRENAELKQFLQHYRADHGVDPAIAFHTAATVDSLNLLQRYLDGGTHYSREGFKSFLVTQVKDYAGLMGKYSIDEDGNANIGFTRATIERKNATSLQ